MKARREYAAVLRCFIIISYVVHLCSAQHITCSVTQDTDRTTYNISDVPHDVEASGCEYSWLNTSETVLANNKNAIKLVITNSIQTLVIPACLEITYERSCLSEGVRHTVPCTTSCRRRDLSQGNKETSYQWGWWVGGALVLLAVVVLVFLGFRHCKSRDKAPRVCSSVQFGCMYTAVKQQNPADVEAGKY